MIPASMLVTNPIMEKLERELVERKICRICLDESEKLIDDVSCHQWNMILSSCFAMSTAISEKLPKFVCEPCCGFLKKCQEFKQMCKTSELLMSTYPLTGKWPDKIEVPSWLRPGRKREHTQVCDDSSAAKKARITSEDSTEIGHCDRNISPIGTIRVRTSEALTLQSPTISSEMRTHFSVEPDNPVIQYCQNPSMQNSYPAAPLYTQYESSLANTHSSQKLSSCPLLQQQLQQSSSLPPPINSLQYLTNSFPQQMSYHQTHQQPQPPPQPFQHIAPVAKKQTAPSKHLPPSTTTVYRPIQPAMPPLPAGAVRCTSCAFVFANQNHLTQHMRKHLGQAEYHCGCGQQFFQLEVFVNHLKQHTNILWCGLCGEQFQADWKLGAHLDQHTLTGLSQACDFCPLVFVDHSSRLRHVGRKHSDEVRQLMCMNPTRNSQ